MKAPSWMMAVAFVAVSVPAVLIMQSLDFGGDFRLLIAMALGAGASGLVQKLGARRKENA